MKKILIFAVAAISLTANAGFPPVQSAAPLSGGQFSTMGCVTASGSQSGCLSSSDFTTFNSKQSAISNQSAPSNQVFNSYTGGTFGSTQLNFNNLSGSATPTQNGVGQVTKLLWADELRSDSYTADGSYARPFKTLMAAINQIITNNDGASYIILLAPGTYSESIFLNSLALHNVSIVGLASGEGFPTSIGAGVTGISSTSNNTNLGTLQIQNVGIQGDVTLAGDVNNTGLCSSTCAFYNVNFFPSSGITLTNVNTVVFKDSAEGTPGMAYNITNASGVVFAGGDGFLSGTLSVVTNLAGNQPNGFGGNTLVILERTLFSATSATVDANSLLQFREGTRFGSSGSSFTMNGTLTTYNSTIRGNMTIGATGSWTESATVYQGTLTNSGTITDAGKYPFVPTASSQWSTPPTTFQEALNKIPVLQQSASGSQPACSSGNRGLTWLVQGGAGVADTFQVCMKNAADAYAWVTK